MNDDFVSDDRLEEAYKIMAGIIQKYGDRFLPIFKRLHEERQLRQANKDLMSIAMQVTNQQND